MIDYCFKIHQLLEKLPLYTYDDGFAHLPLRGIYFFYENSELCSHEGIKKRIVRIGTHFNDNFRKRIKKHYDPNDTYLKITKDTSAPHDKSIFRNHIGRCLLNKENDFYYISNVWKKSKTKPEKRALIRNIRNADKEIRVEKEVSNILRNDFSYRFIIVENENTRVGFNSLEATLIATVAQCKECNPSTSWLGNHSTEYQIRESGLWNIRHVNDIKFSDKNISLFKLLTNDIS